MIRVASSVALAIVVAAPTLAAPPSYDLHATWTGGDAMESVTVDLRVDGKCTFAVARPGGAAERIPCTYWIHGGRVRLRARGEPMGQGLNTLEIEHLRESDTLVILGDRSKTLQ